MKFTPKSAQIVFLCFVISWGCKTKELPEVLGAPERGFISSEPATTWEQGLITGNGTIGANAFGKPLDETIIFTHERLFLPMGDPHIPPDSAARLTDIRDLIDNGEYKAAAELSFNLSGQEGFLYPDPFVPAFDLHIQMDPDGEITNYLRSVNFQTGEATVHWADNRGVFERRMFVSRADGIMVMSIKSSDSGEINCRMKLTPREPSKQLDVKSLEVSSQRFRENIINLQQTADPATLTFTNTFANAYDGSVQGLEGITHIVNTGGNTTVDGETLIISDASEILVLVDIALIYDTEDSQMEEMKNLLVNLASDYKSLLQRHVPLHSELFNRMKLDVGGGIDSTLTTEALLDKTSNENLNRALVQKVFDAGRYNIISCTGELPPTLQGVWGGTYNPGWASDYTHNGNVPSALASMLMGNMPELMLAYTSYIESIVPDLELNARHMFGARGIVLPSRSTTTGYNNALHPRFAGGFWVAGAAWAAHFFYDYYLYTGDQEFLTQHAIPLMEKAALFFEDYLYEGPDGKYIFSPTQSPENTPSNSDSQASYNATMDVAAAKELLNNLITVCTELDMNQDKIPVWQSMLTKMPDYMIGADGAVKEWITPKLEDNHDHRHSSQLYPLYDGIPEEIANNTELQNAFKRIIEIKLDRHWKDNARGFMSFGLVQLGQAAASLGDGELAYQCLIPLVNRYWLNNLASMHNHKTLFNMDISGGLPAVIIKMLVASEPGVIKLLPALPEEWNEGTIEGVLCRGQVEIKRLHWNEKKIQVILVSPVHQIIEVEVPEEIEDIVITTIDPTIEETGKDNVRLLMLTADQEVTLDITMK